MATLTETAYITRKAVNIGFILIVAGVVLRVVLGSAFGLWQMIFPPAPEPANMAFGKLPLPLAQNNIATPSGTLTYTLETADGNLPTMPLKLRVYYMPPTNSSFSSFDRMKATALSLNFTDTPVRVSTTAWRFIDKENPLRVLDIDEISQNFRITYNYLSDQALFNEKNFTSLDQIISSARSYFDGANVSTTEFKAGTPIVTYYKFDSGALVTTTALANADAVGITLSRANVDTGDETIGKVVVVSPDYRQGLVSVLFSGNSASKKKVLEARYLASPVNLENFATYTPISSAQAFDNLKMKKAIFASLPAKTPTDIAITDVYVAYLDPYPSQSYLQPVLVFADKKGFVAYVPLTN